MDLIKIKEDIKVGDIILEAGDKIKVLEAVTDILTYMFNMATTTNSDEEFGQAVGRDIALAIMGTKSKTSPVNFMFGFQEGLKQNWK